MRFSGQRMIRLFLMMCVLSALGLVLQACGNEDDATDTPANNVSAASALSVGDTAPSFTLPAVGGSDVALADYVGSQPVLLYFHMAVG